MQVVERRRTSGHPPELRRPRPWQWVLGGPDDGALDGQLGDRRRRPASRGGARLHQLRPDPRERLVRARLHRLPHRGEGHRQGDGGGEGLPMLDLVFFTPEQLATMQDGDGQQGADTHASTSGTRRRPPRVRRAASRLHRSRSRRGCGWLLFFVAPVADGRLVQLRLQAGHVRHPRERHPLVRPLRRGALPDVLRRRS